LQEASARLVLYANMNDEALVSAGIKLKQYVASCSKGGLPCNITRDFDETFHPYYFNCFKYLTAPSMTAAADGGNSGDEGVPWLMPGLDNGLSVVVLTGSGMLDKNKGVVEVLIPGLYDAGGAAAGSDGVRVVIHPPDVTPIQLAEGFDVPPGFTASLSVRPRRNERIGPPHGNCIDKDPFVSRPLLYRQLTCQQRCLQEFVRKHCGCTDESLPMDHLDIDAIHPCRHIDFPLQCSDAPDDVGPCVDALMRWYERLKCSKRMRRRLQATPAEYKHCQAQCRPACNELVYDVTYSMARWPAPGFEGDAVYEDIFNVNRFMDNFGDSETVRRHFNETGDRAKALQDFARINVYMADAEVSK